MEDKYWSISVGFFNGLLLGSRSYDYESVDKESNIELQITDYVFYLFFFQIICSVVYYNSDE